MLLRFIVGNFLSFKENTEFNMTAGSYRRHKQHVIEINDISLLKATAIYGANGAGKSNLVKAIDTLMKVVLNGTSVLSKKMFFYKNCLKCSSKPTHLEIEFTKDSRFFLYGMEFIDETITEEWLIETISGDLPDRKIFFRTNTNGVTKLELDQRYLSSDKDKIRLSLYEQELLSDTVSFLHLLNKNKEAIIEEAAIAYEFFTSDLFVLFPMGKLTSLAPSLFNFKGFYTFANDLINHLDTGVTQLGFNSIEIERFYGANEQDKIDDIKRKLDKGEEHIPDSSNSNTIVVKEGNEYFVKKLVAYHIGEDGKVEYDLDDESDGTLRLLDFFPALYLILISDTASIIIDEIDRSIHPALLKQVLRKILTQEKSFRGQLIFTTHESNLLDFDLFRQDEIWFANKGKSGNTELYSLSEFDVRADLDWKKGYLNGRFGAIPFLAGLDELNWHSNG